MRDGGIVAFPTETVYGLGANALNADAVARIFAAKGRPATNPVIVHIARLSALAEVALVSPAAQTLAASFWPGPLTMVLPKTGRVPDIVTAGGETVGVRMPRHPVAQELIREADLPIAAPSANRSEQISPTRAEHVALSLGDNVDLILDGGPCEVGIESTVLDLVSDRPRILRPGMITAAQIEAALGIALYSGPASAAGKARSPGQRPRHYAPHTPVLIADTAEIVARASAPACSDAYLVFSPDAAIATSERPQFLTSADPATYAAHLYAALHKLDKLPGIACIVVERLPGGADWDAIRDRLKRAATPPAAGAGV